MPRLLIVALLFGSCGPILAAEPSSVAPARYSAKVKFLRVDGGKQIIAVDTEVTGTKGKLLKTALAGKDGLTLTLDMQDLPGSTPTQYLAQFKLTGKGRVWAEPKLVIVVGRPAKLMVGHEKGDRIEVELVVRDIAAASSAASGHPNKSPSQIIMGGVTPRIIIQEEEEEKLGVAP